MKCMINKGGTVTLTQSEQLNEGDGYCVLEVKACGICGSDIPRVFLGTSYYYPIVLGHEFCCESIEKNIDNFRKEVFER